jgi:SAM-dependent methyltransferase
MTPGERWLAMLWPLVRARLPAPPARVVEIGCGPLGGFVPMLRADNYDAVGIDPQAPEQPHYRRIEFERSDLPERVDAIVASTSLHHVADPADVIDRITRTLTSGGTVVIVEWAWERFDEQTAAWCFERLGSDDDHEGWLHRRRAEWLASGRDWSSYFRDWTARNRIHPWEVLLRLLDERFERRLLTHGPYLFPNLVATTEADEQTAIDAALIQPTRVDYVGRRR